MKSWLQKNLNNIIVVSFLIPILLVAFVSISHVTTFYSTSNPISWAIYLSLAVEVAALAALAGISAKFGRFIYLPFGIVTLIQFVGNFFYSYSYIDPQGEQFRDWIDMVSGLFEPMGIDPTDTVAHRRLLAFLTGGLIPFISLTFAHMLIVYSNKLQTNQEVNQKTVLQEPNTKIGNLIIEEDPNHTDKINPTIEELEEMKSKLAQMQTKTLPEILVEDNTVKRLSYTKNV